MSAKSNCNAFVRTIYGKYMPVLVASAGLIGISSQAQAFTVNAIFASSVTSAPNAATIISAFNTAAAAYTSAFTNPVTVNITVGWGEVGGQALSSNSSGASSVALAGYWTYAQMRTYLAPNVSLPATQTGPNYFAMARAEAKALGLVAATSTRNDGSVGFNSSLNWDFNPAGGISGYDFVGVAQHEIAEVLGRNTVITSSAGIGFYQKPVDLFRYSAPGVQNYSYTDATYFSLDAGVTNLGWWDNSGGGGDRSDWLTGSGGSYPGDVQNAYLYPGATSLSLADLALLGAIGWSGTPQTQADVATFIGTSHGFSNVPEPASAMVLTVGLTGLALARHSRSRVKV